MHRLFVHILVLMVLQLLKLVETFSLINESSIGVRTSPAASTALELPCLENVLNPLQGNSDESRIVASEQIAEGLDTALGYQIPAIKWMQKMSREFARDESTARTYLICSGEPPEVALDMDQAASFLMSNSATDSKCTRGGMMFASMTAWICSRVPAVMLEMVQQASLRIPFFGLDRSASSLERAPQLITHWVWLSSPVTMFPAVRKAGVWTEAGG